VPAQDATPSVQVLLRTRALLCRRVTSYKVKFGVPVL